MAKIVHISDLHFTAQRKNKIKTKFFWKFFYVDNTIDSNLFAEKNAEGLGFHISQIHPTHIIITGDVTTTGHEDEFENAKRFLLQLQEKIKSTQPKEAKDIAKQNQGQSYGRTLDAELFTIIPGNHDVVDKYEGSGKYSKLGMFLKYFGETIPSYNTTLTNFDNLFPFNKEIGKNTVLTGLNSTQNISVEKIWRNAIGQIDESQLLSLPKFLNHSKFKIIALHHHPLPIPYIDDFEDLLILKNPRRFLYICDTNKVNLVLHGHKHQPFMWQSNPWISGIDPKHQNNILAAGAATVNRPFAKSTYYVLEEEKDKKGRIYYRLNNFEWDEDKEDFVQKSGPFISRKDIIEIIDEHPDILEKTVYLNDYHEKVLREADKIWSYCQKFDYQFTKYFVHFKMINNNNLEYIKRVTIKGSPSPDKNPIHILRTYVKGKPDIEYRDLNLTVKPIGDDGDIGVIPCVDYPQEKRFLIYFLPEIASEDDVRRYEINCRWPNFWDDFFKSGEYSVTEHPKCEGTIDKFIIRFTTDKKYTSKLKCSVLPNNQGTLFDIKKDKDGNIYCEWIINNAEADKNYQFIIKKL